MIAEDIMTRDPLTVTEGASIGEALTMLSEEGIRHLPVVRFGDVIGILSDRDFASIHGPVAADQESVDSLKARLNLPVSSLMTGGVMTVDADSDLTEIIDLMLDEKLSAVPVVQTATQRLIGIVSYVDVLRAARPLFEEA